jgi:hypothetical protein
MAHLLDTNVAIYLRDGDAAITDKVAALNDAVLMSIVTRVELEGGVYREPAHARLRRARLDAILEAVPTIAFDDEAAEAYGAIVAEARLFSPQAARPHDRRAGDRSPCVTGDDECQCLCRHSRTVARRMVGPLGHRQFD